MKAGDTVAEADDTHLGKSGGCLLLSSNQISIEIAKHDSNHNVEFIIAEATSLNTAFILVYNPPSNFLLRKFKEAVGPIKIYLNQNKQKTNPIDIILTGDFNFPSDLVTWDKSKAGTGVNPILKNGETELKKGFRILNKMVEVHNLTQMVDTITHWKEIIDLVYTNNPLSFSECKTSMLSPQSDHKLVSFHITTNVANCVKGDAKTYSKNLLEVATFDYSAQAQLH